jgi:ribosomal protein L40E
MAAFLEREKETWSCKKCGGPVSVHTALCRDCGSKRE